MTNGYDYQRLHDDLEHEIADLRAVVSIEVDRAQFGIVPGRYLRRVIETERARKLEPLPPDHPLAHRRPWGPADLVPSLDELCRRPGEGWGP